MKTIKEKTGRKSFLLKFLEENQRKTGRRRKPEENPEAKVESFKSTNSEGYRLALTIMAFCPFVLFGRGIGRTLNSTWKSPIIIIKERIAVSYIKLFLGICSLG